MKKALLLAGVMLALATSRAAAAGINLGWENCPTTTLSTADAADPCDNSGFHSLIGTAVAPPNLTKVTGEEMYVDMETASSTLPDFWHMEVGGCRDGSLLVTAVFFGLNTVSCRNYWGTSAAGGFDWKAPFLGENGGPNRARLSVVFARVPSTATFMTAGVQYYLFKADIDGNHAVADPLNGITQCDGCTVPGCWVFNEAILTQPVGYGDAIITNADVRNFVTWQGGGGTDCPTAVPARRVTWGEIKGHYR